MAVDADARQRASPILRIAHDDLVQREFGAAVAVALVVLQQALPQCGIRGFLGGRVNRGVNAQATDIGVLAPEVEHGLAGGLRDPVRVHLGCADMDLG